MRESEIQKQIMLIVSEAGHLIFRNNSGSYKDPRSGSFIKYGVGSPGGSDLIGIHNPSGRLIAIEVKTKTGRASPAQLQFIDAVLQAGGIAGICRSAQDAIDLIKNT